MEVEEAIRTRRTHKAYRPEPVDRGQLEELLDLARWAPNHNLTNPWRFRVIGPQALERLKQAAGPESAAKLDRAPTLVVVSCALTGDPIQDEEDLHADGLRRLHRPARRARPGWRATGAPPRSSARPEGRAAVGLPDGERFVGLLHLGTPVQEQRAPDRLPRRPGRGVPRCDPSPMISRNDALQALQEHPFDVVVDRRRDHRSRGRARRRLARLLGGAVERDDFARGTSSRSSKMVHGGLRYLQNFDLGLVREALLERQLLVQLAPHLVYPTPFLVPALGEERRDRRIGIGLNMYDVMATSRIGRGRSQRTEHGDEADYWSPDRHRTISGRGGHGADPGARPHASPARPTSSTTARPMTSRLVLTDPGRGRALRRGGAERRGRDRGARRGRARGGVAFREAAVRARASRFARPTSSTRPASGRIGSAPTSSSPRRRSRGFGPAAAPM